MPAPAMPSQMASPASIMVFQRRAPRAMTRASKHVPPRRSTSSEAAAPRRCLTGSMSGLRRKSECFDRFMAVLYAIGGGIREQLPRGPRADWATARTGVARGLAIRRGAAYLGRRVRGSRFPANEVTHEDRIASGAAADCRLRRDPVLVRRRRLRRGRQYRAGRLHGPFQRRGSCGLEGACGRSARAGGDDGGAPRRGAAESRRAHARPLARRGWRAGFRRQGRQPLHGARLRRFRPVRRLEDRGEGGQRNLPARLPAGSDLGQPGGIGRPLQQREASFRAALRGRSARRAVEYVQDHHVGRARDGLPERDSRGR